MTREIKPRAWDKKEKVMCEVEIINFNKGCFLVDNSPTPDSISEEYYINGPKEGHFVVWEDLEFMKPVGLKDKNGTDIYEGDIVLWPSYHEHLKGNKNPYMKGKIVYSDGCWWIWNNGSRVSIAHLAMPYSPHTPACYPTDFEVLGNIHQNPKLLKQ